FPLIEDAVVFFLRFKGLKCQPMRAQDAALVELPHLVAQPAKGFGAARDVFDKRRGDGVFSLIDDDEYGVVFLPLAWLVGFYRMDIAERREMPEDVRQV